MGIEKEGEIEFRSHIIEQLQHLSLHRHIQRRYGFVRNQQPRFHGERARNCDPLTLAAGELVREAIECIWLQTDELHQILRCRCPPDN